jgi:hypothetical protein
MGALTIIVNGGEKRNGRDVRDVIVNGWSVRATNIALVILDAW